MWGRGVGNCFLIKLIFWVLFATRLSSWMSLAADASSGALLHAVLKTIGRFRRARDGERGAATTGFGAGTTAGVEDGAPKFLTSVSLALRWAQHHRTLP